MCYGCMCVCVCVCLHVFMRTLMCVRVYALYNTPGTTATTGLKDVAELGSTFTLLGEVNRLNCYSGDRIRSGGLGDATGSLVDYLNVDRCSALHVAVCVCVCAFVCTLKYVCVHNQHEVAYCTLKCTLPVAGLWLACGWPVCMQEWLDIHMCVV